MSKLHFVVGCARAGKSTFSKSWLEEQKQSEVASVIVNADVIRLALHGERFNGSREPEVHHIKNIMIKSLLMQDFTVLVDETHTSYAALHSVFDFDPHATLHILPTTVEVCIERAHATGQSDLVEPIKRMNDNLLRLIKNAKAEGLSREEGIRAGVEKVRRDFINRVNHGRD